MIQNYICILLFFIYLTLNLNLLDAICESDNNLVEQNEVPYSTLSHIEPSTQYYFNPTSARSNCLDKDLNLNATVTDEIHRSPSISSNVYVTTNSINCNAESLIATSAPSVSSSELGSESERRGGGLYVVINVNQNKQDETTVSNSPFRETLNLSINYLSNDRETINETKSCSDNQVEDNILLPFKKRRKLSQYQEESYSGIDDENCLDITNEGTDTSFDLANSNQILMQDSSQQQLDNISYPSKRMHSIAHFIENCNLPSLEFKSAEQLRDDDTSTFDTFSQNIEMINTECNQSPDKCSSICFPEFSSVNTLNEPNYEMEQPKSQPLPSMDTFNVSWNTRLRSTNTIIKQEYPMQDLEPSCFCRIHDSNELYMKSEPETPAASSSSTSEEHQQVTLSAELWSAIKDHIMFNKGGRPALPLNRFDPQLEDLLDYHPNYNNYNWNEEKLKNYIENRLSEVAQQNNLSNSNEKIPKSHIEKSSKRSPKSR